MINKFEFQDTDPRVRKYILPKRIVLTKGEIENSECLLTYRDRQIQLQERDFMTMNGKSAILFDFGVEFHGGVQISVHKVKGQPNAKMRFCFGESVSEALSQIGFKGACNDHSARDFTVNIQSYSANEYASTGYRFLYLELLDDCTVTVKTLQGIFVYKPYEYIGSFECSDKRLNEIYDVSAYTCHLCMQNQLWDGIKRDRLLWIGDMAPELKTIKYVFGDTPEIMSGLKLSADDAVLPNWINKHPTYSMWWLINLVEWCEYTNNFKYIDDMRDYALPLTKQILDNIDKDGYFTAGDFIDWPSKNKPASREGTRALTIMCMDACIKLCNYLNQKDLAQKCIDMRDFIKNTNAGCDGLKQIAALLKLTGIADKECDDVLNTGSKGFSTFMSYYILSAMAKVCSTQDTLDALKEYYGGMLDMGATTFWEDFDLEWTKNACRIDEICPEDKSDIHADNGAYCYKGLRHSLCHGWASGPVPFLTEFVLGINLVDGCKVVKLSPNLANLDYAKGSIATPFGKLSVKYTKDRDGKIVTEVDAPKEIVIIK